MLKYQIITLTEAQGDLAWAAAYELAGKQKIKIADGISLYRFTPACTAFADAIEEGKVCTRNQLSY
jgi:hypothetical protein